MQEDNISKASSFNQFNAKVIVLGDFGVGKSTLVSTINKNSNLNRLKTESTTISENQLVRYTVDDDEIILKVWDTAGQEKYRSITISFYKDVRGAFLCFDLTNQQTFDNLQIWNKQIRQHGDEGIIKILIGTKCDEKEQRVVSEQSIKQMTEELNCIYFETSAWDRQNIDQAFKEMAVQIHTKLKEKGQNVNEDDSNLLKGSKRRGGQVEDDRSFCFCF